MSLNPQKKKLNLTLTYRLWGIVCIVLMSPFSWQCQNLCLLSLAFLIDWRVLCSFLVDVMNNCLKIFCPFYRPKNVCVASKRVVRNMPDATSVDFGRSNLSPPPHSPHPNDDHPQSESHSVKRKAGFILEQYY